MKRFFFGFGLNVALVFVASQSCMAGTAQAQLANNSIHIYAGPCSCGFGLTWKIHFSTFYTEDPPYANGEVAPLPLPATHTLWSYLILEDPSLYASGTYAELDLPTTDSDANGILDFLEVNKAVSISTSGTYATIFNPGYGLLTLQWSRAEGSPSGTLLLFMDDPALGQMGPFTHTFELVEQYSGTLTYHPGSTNVTGTMVLVKTSQAPSPLSGSVTFLKSDTNRFDLLTLSSGDWSNQTEVFSFGECQLRRDAAHPMAYSGTLQNPGGAFSSWTLSIVDTNDANGNGIPDFSDDLTNPTPRRPILLLSCTPTNLLLRVSGDVGRIHAIEQASSLNSTNWQTIQTFTLTNDPQLRTLSLPETTPTFWRVRAQ